MSKKTTVVHILNGWAVRPAGGERASSVHTHTERSHRSRTRDRNNQVCELLVHGRNGRIRERDSSGAIRFLTRLRRFE